jgi:hypothetical protein
MDMKAWARRHGHESMGKEAWTGEDLCGRYYSNKIKLN